MTRPVLTSEPFVFLGHVLLHDGIPFLGTSNVEFNLLIDGGASQRQVTVSYPKLDTIKQVWLRTRLDEKCKFSKQTQIQIKHIFDPVRCCLSGSVRSGPDRSGMVWSGPCGQVRSGPISTGPFQSHAVQSGPVDQAKVENFSRLLFT